MSRIKKVLQWGRYAAVGGFSLAAVLLIGRHGRVWALEASSNGGLEQKFQELDRNHDGRLTPDELPDKKWFRRLDVDGDGVITHEEARSVFAKALNGGQGKMKSGERLFKRLDKNGDGKLTPDELPNKEQFAQYDVNGDGVITLEEAKSVFANAIAMSRIAGGETAKAAPAEPVSPRMGPRLLRGADAGVGRMLADVSFKDIDGKAGRLSDYQANKALVIAITSTSCPVSKRYAPTLAELEKEYASQGVAFLYVNPTESDGVKDIKADIEAHGFQGHYVLDVDGKLVSAIGARTTTEAFVVDAKRTVVYSGAVSDQYGLGYSHDNATETYLKDAIEATLRGTTPEVVATTSPGCALSSDKKPVKTDITYYNQIARIMQNNCVECHHQGGVAPFSLTTYEDVKSHAGMIKRQVSNGFMPPWFAVPEKGETISPWINDRSLTSQEKDELLTWLASDRPPGNAAEAPLPVKLPEDWQIGKPDMVVQIPKPIDIKATGTMPYQNVVVETELKEDKWVKAFEIQPTARQAVHHVLVFVRPPKGSKDGFDDARAERQGFFAAYVPGNSYKIYPEGMAKKLPAGSRLHFQIHYTPNGKPVQDQLKLGLVFTDTPPEHVMQVFGISNPFLNIPPNTPDHVETAQVKVPFDVNLLEFMPHMHLRGKAVKYEVLFADGSAKTVLDIPRYDFNWQLAYRLAEPMRVPAGSTIKVTAVFDNSTGNPANPDPNRTVHWGQQTYDEMLLGYVGFYTPNDMPLKGGKKLRAAIK